MKLVLEVMDAYDLPFVEAEFDGQVHRTATKLNDLNPSGNQTLVFTVSDSRSLHDKTLQVTVYHDPSSLSSRRRQFLGRVRISGFFIACSPSEAQVQRSPLEKRDIFSNIRGDLAH